MIRALFNFVISTGAGILALIGIGLCFYGYLNQQEQVIWLGALILTLTIVLLFGAAIDALFHVHHEITNPSSPKKSERTKPICCLCDGGPGNPRSPVCSCGGEHWDIHDIHVLDIP